MTNNTYNSTTPCSGGTKISNCPDERSYNFGIEGFPKVLSKERLGGEPSPYPGHCKNCGFYLNPSEVEAIDGLETIEEFEALKLMSDIGAVARNS